MSISTHVLDTSRGRPAAGVPVRLERAEGSGWHVVASAVTDSDGRVPALAGHASPAATYRLHFDTAAYAAATGSPSFYPFVEITFVVAAGSEHHHVPLLLSPFGYSTYRGS